MYRETCKCLEFEKILLHTTEMFLIAGAQPVGHASVSAQRSLGSCFTLVLRADATM